VRSRQCTDSISQGRGRATPPRPYSLPECATRRFRMTSRSIRLLIICTSATFISWASPALGESSNANVISAVSQWTRPYDVDLSIGFLDPEANSIPEELYGVAIANDGAILVSDRITDAAILIDPHGTTSAALGQAGEGPEDHRELGGALFLDNGSCGVFDSSFAKKVVVFERDGSYASTIYLGGYRQYVRLLRCEDGYVGLAVAPRANNSGGLSLAVGIASFWPNGAVRDTLQLVDHELPPPDPNVRMKEEDFEIIPKIASGPSGRIFVQEDLYKWRIECFDRELKSLWTIERDVSARERTAEETQQRRDQMMQKLTPARCHHIIRQMIARDDGALWVRSDGQTEPPGQLRFSRWNAEGKRESDVSIQGLPHVAGRVIIEGDWLFWTRPADWELEEGQYAGQPYMALYRLMREDPR